MSAECGPYVQMGKLAQQMANQYGKDPNLALEPLLAHFIDEVEVNVAADRFDHLGFMTRIRSAVAQAAAKATEGRVQSFLQAVVQALELCIARHGGSSPASSDRAVNPEGLQPLA